MTTERAGILPYVADSIPCPNLAGLVLSLADVRGRRARVR
jgi:hypothetical protein